MKVIADPTNNKWLTLAPGVTRTPITDMVIVALEPTFAKRQHKATVTSILRKPEDQLRIIREECIKRGIDKEFPEILTCSVDSISNLKTGVYAWQGAWSRLLNKGFIVSPPKAAVVLFDYWKNGKNKKGEIIQPSGHFLGTCFDIGGRGGLDDTPADEVEIISDAMAGNPKIGIRSFLLERKNNCLHINVG